MAHLKRPERVFRGRAARWLWLPLAWLVVAAGAAGLVLGARRWLPYLLGGGAALLALAWLLASTLSSGRPERCPRCGRETLEPLRPGEPLGIRCRSCGHLDPDGHLKDK